MEALCRALQEEQELLDVLLFRLVETRLLLHASELRFVARAAEEVERARRRTREADLLRAAAVQRLGDHKSHRRAPTLRALAASSDDPWRSMLRDHHDAMASTVAEIEVVAHQNARLAQTEHERLAGRAELVEGPIPVTGDGGASELRLATEAGLDAVLGGAARLRMPALLSFLR